MPSDHNPDPSDETLWAEYLDGSESAFRRLQQRYEEPIFRYLQLSGLDPKDAAQALGQVLCHIATYRRQPEGFGSIREWFYAVATQKVVPAHVPDEDGLADFLSQIKEGRPESASDRFRRALDGMQRKIRQPFLLVTLAGLSTQEAARACRFRPGTTERRIELAYRRLSGCVPDDEELQ
ncbi:MAG: RNA polymerase sigma factor [Planctomycetota bacterium]